MRTMVKGSQSVQVFRWLALKNGWEYYLIAGHGLADDGDLQMALVIGFEQEMGRVSLDEISRYIACSVSDKQLMEIAPAPGWEWKS